jgi:hypothetical protein
MSKAWGIDHSNEKSVKIAADIHLKSKTLAPPTESLLDTLVTTTLQVLQVFFAWLLKSHPTYLKTYQIGRARF